MQLTDEHQHFQMFLSVFYFKKYLKVKISTSSFRGCACGQTPHSVACLSDSLVRC